MKETQRNLQLSLLEEELEGHHLAMQGKSSQHSFAQREGHDRNLRGCPSQHPLPSDHVVAEEVRRLHRDKVSGAKKSYRPLSLSGSNI